MKKKETVLIISDDRQNVSVLVDTLKYVYEVLVMKTGQEAIQTALYKTPPDILLLDTMITDIDIYETCRQLKENESDKEIPVILISDMIQMSDETEISEVGVVDYISKPVNASEVKTRVSTHLKLRHAMLEIDRLSNTAIDLNPVTGLPGSNSIARRIIEAIECKETVCVIYSDLDYFKAFNERFGFAIGDKVLNFTSVILKESLMSVISTDSFLAHNGGDDFVMVVPTDKSHTATDEIMQRFDDGVKAFYSSTEIASNCIETIDRKGVPKISPLLSISLAGVNLSGLVYKQYAEVKEASTGVMKMAKSIPGSSFFMDRRGKSVLEVA